MRAAAMLAAAVVLCALAPAAAAAVPPASAAPAPAPLGVTGKYELLGQAPIAAAHAMQLPCGSDSFLLMEFGPTGREGQLMLPHPALNPDGTKVLWLWDRGAKSWKNINTSINSICGGWAKLANGHVGMFSGHYQTLGYKQVFGMNRIVVYDATQQRTQIRANLTAQRWYPTALALPNGDVWVPGGTWAQKPNGSWPKAAGADIYTWHSDKVVQAPLNRRLWDASIGNWYMGSLVLPSGKVAVLNMNMAQVLDPYTGDAVAEAPPLPDPVKDMVWEFPRMGAQKVLRADPYAPGKPSRYEFAVFGGSFADAALRREIAQCGPVTCDRQKGQQRPCSEYAVRIGLTLHTDGRHEFDKQWEVEKMPGPRCIFDGVLLPNGHIVFMGGQKRGIGDLTNASHYNGGNQPWNKPWIYNPYAPKGSRFTVPGATTKIARLYHAVAQLTSRGDILATGTSNAAFWQSDDAKDFDRTALGVNEYRQELYLPPYLFRPHRPVLAEPQAPAWVPYGGTFKLGYSFPDGPGNITGVVWVEPGGTTHNYAIGHRLQLLAFDAVPSDAVGGRSAGVVSVHAPPDAGHAPPGFYIVFLLSGDLYSEGVWVQIRSPPPRPLAGVVSPSAQLVPGLSGGLDGAAGGGGGGGGGGGSGSSWGLLAFRLTGGGDAGVHLETGSPAARAAGAGGLRASLAPGKSGPVRARLASGVAWLQGGKNCTLMLWARGAQPGQPLFVSVVPKGGGSKPALPPSPLSLSPERACLFTLPVFAPPAGGDYEIVVEGDLTAWKPRFDVDEVELYCMP